jgi:poly-gamma-glutamate synthesis protein (capsule biosynthesis protein)
LASNDEQEFVIAATGDSMISRRISVHRKSEPVAELIRKADVGFTNCEILFHRCESYNMVRTNLAEEMMYAEPSLAKELAWIGFDMVSLSNSHSLDYGPPAMFCTMKALEESGLVYAGVGRDLEEAREPKYLETEKGRVALIAACYDTWHQYWERASNARAGVPARPGMNLLYVDSRILVRKELFGVLRRIVSESGLDPPAGRRTEQREGELTLLGQKFKCGDKPGIQRSVRKQDVEDAILSIRDARKSADLVLVSLHCHTSDAKGLEYPADFVCQYARTCIDAGADAFLGHGPHILRGVEIYKKKPIFYGLGNFIAQNQTVKKVTHDQYSGFDLGERAKPSDYYEARYGIVPPSEPPYARWWFESVVVMFKMRESTITECKLYPVAMGFGEKHRAHIGYPELAEEREARGITQHVREISTQWKTQIAYADGIGEVLL